MKDTELEQDNAINEAVEVAVKRSQCPSVAIDVERYQAYLDDPNLSPEHRKEILEALWAIMTAFVQLGFGVHPAQQACGKLGLELEETSFPESTEVQSDHCEKLDNETPSP